MFSPVVRSLRLLLPRDRRVFTLLTLARVVTSFLDVAGLIALGALGALLAAGLGDGPAPGFLGFTLTGLDLELLVVLLVAVAGFFVGKSFLGVILLSVQLRFLSRVEANLASRLIRHLHAGSISRIQEVTDGKVLWTLNPGSKIATSGLLVTFATLITESALLLFVLGLFLLVDVGSAVAIFAYFGLVVFVFQALVKTRLTTLGERVADSGVRSTNTAQDLTVAFREITVLARKKHFFSRFDSARREYATSANQQALILALPRYIVEAALMVGVLGLVAWQAGRGNLQESLPVIAVFLAGGVRMMAALLPLQNSISNLRTMAPQATPVFDLAEKIDPSESEEKGPEPSEAGSNSTDAREINVGVIDAGDSGVGGAGAGDSDAEDRGVVINVAEVTFSYPSAAKPAIRQTSLTIESGSFTAIVGPSGAGKTTLADLLLGIHLPTQGTITLDGQSPQILRASSPGIISYVPQSPGMVAGTIAHNVALGVADENIDRDRVREVLRMVQLADFVDEQPHGLDTDLGARSDALSGGQRQRLGLARALYTSPRLIILDEATSALDASTEANISDMIRQLGKKVTLIVIAHRLSTIQDADNVIVFDGGQPIAQGTFPAVRKAVPMIEEYVQLMSFDEVDKPEGEGPRA
jgi:ABC-type multidrug transport system fused ATPase/permease subunit